MSHLAGVLRCELTGEATLNQIRDVYRNTAYSGEAYVEELRRLEQEYFVNYTHEQIVVVCLGLLMHQLAYVAHQGKDTTT